MKDKAQKITLLFLSSIIILSTFVVAISLADVGEIETDGVPKHMAKKGNVMAVTDRSDNFILYDLTNPLSSFEIGRVNLGLNSNANDIAVKKNHYYVTDSTSNSLLIIDSTPAIIGSVEIGEIPDEVRLKGHYAYITDSDDGIIRIVNVKNKANPKVVGVIDIEGQSFGLDIRKNTMYVGAVDTNEIIVYDISDRVNPVETDRIPVGDYPWKIIAKKNYVYVADLNDKNVRIIRTSDNTVISTIQFINEEPRSIAIKGKKLYVGLSFSGSFSRRVAVYTLDDKTNPVEISSTPLGGGLITDLHVNKNYVYASSGATQRNIEILQIGGHN